MWEHFWRSAVFERFIHTDTFAHMNTANQFVIPGILVSVQPLQVERETHHEERPLGLVPAPCLASRSCVWNAHPTLQQVSRRCSPWTDTLAAKIPVPSHIELPEQKPPTAQPVRFHVVLLLLLLLLLMATLSGLRKRCARGPAHRGRPGSWVLFQLMGRPAIGGLVQGPRAVSTPWQT